MDQKLIVHPAYIVLELIPPMSDFVRALRKKYDPPRAEMPVEITLTGSCGTGHIVPGQRVDFIAAEMDRVAAGFAPFEAVFSGVERFPNTEIYFLTVENALPFEAVRFALEHTAIQFTASPFPYCPHCTLKLREAPDDGELLEILFTEVPKTPFSLTRMSLYSLSDPQHCELLHTVKLHGNQ